MRELTLCELERVAGGFNAQTFAEGAGLFCGAVLGAAVLPEALAGLALYSAGAALIGMGSAGGALMGIGMRRPSAR